MSLLQAVGQGSEHKPCMVHFSHVPAGRATGEAPRLRRQGHHVRLGRSLHQARRGHGRDEARHERRGERRRPHVRSSGASSRTSRCTASSPPRRTCPTATRIAPATCGGSLDGKSVEIINTDAEGRLILADALAYARALEPDLLVDNATLTGACVVALGNSCSGWYASNEDDGRGVPGRRQGSGEQMWRLPLLEDLKDQLKSDSADLKHTGDRWGGSISAALFLREFIGNVANWVHCDIAGPAMGDRTRGWDPKGGTGHGVLTFLELVERASKATGAARQRLRRPAKRCPAAKAPAPKKAAGKKLDGSAEGGCAKKSCRPEGRCPEGRRSAESGDEDCLRRFERRSPQANLVALEASAAAPPA